MGEAAPGRRAPGPGAPPDRRARSDTRWSASRTGPRRSPSGGVPRHIIGGSGGPAGSRPARAAVPPVSGCAPPGESRRKTSLASRGLFDPRVCGHVPCLLEEPRCANLVWTHLAHDRLYVSIAYHHAIDTPNALHRTIVWSIPHPDTAC